MAAAVFASVRSGDHVVCVARPYSWTRGLLRDLLPRFGVTTTFVDGTDTGNFERELKGNTRLIVLESPNSMTYEQQDLAAVSAIARTRDIRTVCDNSYATPLNQSPLAHGVEGGRERPKARLIAQQLGQAPAEGAVATED